MNKTMSRGLALVAITGGFSILGATAANAVDLPDLSDLGGTTGSSILDALRVQGDANAPVTIDGLNASVLNGNDASSLLGDGVGANTNSTTADMFAALGLDLSDVVDNEQLTSMVGIPVDVSNSWVSVLGNEPNGIVVVPRAAAPASAEITDGADGALNAFVDAPISISCTSVAVISDFENDCAEGSSTGTDGIVDGDILGDLLGGDVAGDATHNEVPVDVRDKQIDVLDGGVLGDNGDMLGSDGILIDPTDDVTDLSTDADPIDAQKAFVGAPVDASEAWVSVLGENEGVVVVPDSTVDASLLTLGLVDSETLAPITLDCLTVTVLSDFERNCAAGPTEPTEPTEPADPGTVDTGDDGNNDGATDNGGNGGTDDGDVCVTGTTLTAATDTNNGVDAGLLGGAALAGGLTAFGLMALGRKIRVL